MSYRQLRNVVLVQGTPPSYYSFRKPLNFVHNLHVTATENVSLSRNVSRNLQKTVSSVEGAVLTMRACTTGAMCRKTRVHLPKTGHCSTGCGQQSAAWMPTVVWI
jgi:hypothetical protein